jgi:Fe-S-cluster-containing hydrogenase component 2
MSAGEGMLFAEVVDKFTRKVKALGPLGAGESLDGDELKAKIQEVERLVPYIKMAMRDKLARQFDKVEEYAGLYTSQEIEQLFREVPSYYIDPEKCQACMTCAKRCPVEAIAGGKNLIHVVDQDKCIKCGTCLEACPPRFGAVTRLAGLPVPPPIPEEKRVLVRKTKEKAEQA